MSRQPASALDLGRTEEFHDQVLNKVTLWSAEPPGDLRHWRTSFHFAGQPPRVGTAIYEGISVDMIQPLTHEHYDPDRDGSVNLYGSLKIMPRVMKDLYSARQGMFKSTLDFKKKAVKVKDVVGLILEQNRQCYKFNPAGSGCLFWHFQLLEAFVVKGWISRASLDTTYTRISGLAAAPSSAGTVPYPPVEGTFYPPHKV